MAADGPLCRRNGWKPNAPWRPARSMFACDRWPLALYGGAVTQIAAQSIQRRGNPMPRMSASEAFVETLVAQGVTDVFGIVGSAYMDALDLFPTAGIRFIPTVHEQGAAHMADGYSRVSGRSGVCIAQNGPGITNFVTAIAAAFWAHTPVVAIT